MPKISINLWKQNTWKWMWLHHFLWIFNDLISFCTVEIFNNWKLFENLHNYDVCYEVSVNFFWLHKRQGERKEKTDLQTRIMLWCLVDHSWQNKFMFCSYLPHQLILQEICVQILMANSIRNICREFCFTSKSRIACFWIFRGLTENIK